MGRQARSRSSGRCRITNFAISINSGSMLSIELLFALYTIYPLQLSLSQLQASYAEIKLLTANMSASEIARGTQTYRRATYPAIDVTQSSLSTEGKSAVITGAGQGIGASIARSLARSGVTSLALMGRRPEPLASVKATLWILSMNRPSKKVSLHLRPI